MGAAVLSRLFLDHADVSQQCFLAPEFCPEVKHHRRRFHHEHIRGFYPEIETKLHPDGRAGSRYRPSEAAEYGSVEMAAEDPFHLGMFRDEGLKLFPPPKFLLVHVSDG